MTSDLAAPTIDEHDFDAWRAELAGRIDRSLVLGHAWGHLDWRATAHVAKWSPDTLADAGRVLSRVPRARRELLTLDRWRARRMARGILAATEDELTRFGVTPDERRLWSDNNILCNNGINRLLNLGFVGGSIVLYDATHVRLGVGDGTTAVANTDTDLSAVAGSTHRWFQIPDATYPSVASQTATLKATTANADAVFAWNEWGMDGGGATSGNTVGTNTTTLGALLNHVKPGTSLGTKTGGSWALTVTLSIA